MKFGLKSGEGTQKQIRKEEICGQLNQNPLCTCMNFSIRIVPKRKYLVANNRRK